IAKRVCGCAAVGQRPDDLPFKQGMRVRLPPAAPVDSPCRLASLGTSGNIRLGSSTAEDPPLKRGMWVRLPPEAPDLGASLKELWQSNLSRRWWRRGM